MGERRIGTREQRHLSFERTTHDLIVIGLVVNGLVVIGGTHRFMLPVAGKRRNVSGVEGGHHTTQQ
jgi:hypothetical protein